MPERCKRLENVTLYVDELALKMPEQHLSAFRAYVVLKNYDRICLNGSGRVVGAVRILMEQLQISRESARRALRAGEGIFFRVRKHKKNNPSKKITVYPYSWRRVYAEFDARQRAKPVGVPIDRISGNIRHFRGYIYAVRLYFTAEDKKLVDRREAIASSIGVSVPTLRRHVADGWIKQAARIRVIAHHLNETRLGWSHCKFMSDEELQEMRRDKGVAMRRWKGETVIDGNGVTHIVTAVVIQQVNAYTSCFSDVDLDNDPRFDKTYGAIVTNKEPLDYYDTFLPPPDYGYVRSMAAQAINKPEMLETLTRMTEMYMMTGDSLAVEMIRDIVAEYACTGTEWRGGDSAGGEYVATIIPW